MKLHKSKFDELSFVDVKDWTVCGILVSEIHRIENWLFVTCKNCLNTRKLE